MDDYSDEPDDAARYDMHEPRELPQEPINWNLLDADEAELEWRDLDVW